MSPHRLDCQCDCSEEACDLVAQPRLAAVGDQRANADASPLMWSLKVLIQVALDATAATLAAVQGVMHSQRWHAVTQRTNRKF